MSTFDLRLRLGGLVQLCNIRGAPAGLGAAPTPLKAADLLAPAPKVVLPAPTLASHPCLPSHFTHILALVAEGAGYSKLHPGGHRREGAGQQALPLAW